MIKKIEEQVVSYFLPEEVLSLEELEICLYGLNMMIKKACHIVFILGLGFILGEFYGTLLFLVIYAQIREYSGGYHADSSTGCYCCTIIATVCAIALIKVLPQINLYWSLGCMLICGGIIWGLSPQEAENKPLMEMEKRKYQYVTRKYLLISGGICVFWGIYPLIMYSVVTAWTIQAIMLGAGKLKSTCKRRKRI